MRVGRKGAGVRESSAVRVKSGVGDALALAANARDKGESGRANGPTAHRNIRILIHCTLQTERSTQNTVG